MNISDTYYIAVIKHEGAKGEKSVVYCVRGLRHSPVFSLTTAVFAPERPEAGLGVFATPGPAAFGSAAVVDLFAIT